ncbi:MAG: metalloregulator ArsR/SmtB family transcription factor [Bacteroidota bacterium]
MQDSVTGILKAMADPTRRQIFHALILGTTALPITQISNQFDISRQGVTKHLKILEDAGLIEIEKRGRERYCQADANPLKLISEWVVFYEKFWDNSLRNLDAYLDSK